MQVQSELQFPQNKVQEQVHQNEVLQSQYEQERSALRQQASQYEEEPRKVRQYEEEGVALRRAFRKQAEQLLFTSEIA